MRARPEQGARRIVPVLLLVGLLILVGLLLDRTPSLHQSEGPGPDVENTTP